MPTFNQRHCLYKTGVVVLWLSALLAVWGVVSPGWLEDGVFYTGLWWRCKVVFANCVVVNLKGGDPLSFSRNDNPVAVFYAVVGLCCLGAATLMVTSLTVLRHECCVTSSWTGRGAGFSAVLGGILLGSGFGLFDYEARDPNLKLGPSAIAAIFSSIAATVAGVAMAAFGGTRTTSSETTPLLLPSGGPQPHPAQTPPPPPYDSSGSQWAYQGPSVQPYDYSSSFSHGPPGVQPQFPHPAMSGPPQDFRTPSAPAPGSALAYNNPRSGSEAMYYLAGSEQVIAPKAPRRGSRSAKPNDHP